MSNAFPPFAFALGREFRLSIAEIASVCGFHSIVSATDKLAFVKLPNREAAVSAFLKLGGSVRVFEIVSRSASAEFTAKSAEYLKGKAEASEGKSSFALASVGADLPLFDFGLKVKKLLRADKLSVRLSNVDARTINAASFKKDRLSETLLECAYLEAEREGYFAVTLACQDVDKFAERDLSKGRDMQVGMLPPKLARMMVNLAGNQVSSVYDPFCGL